MRITTVLFAILASLRVFAATYSMTPTSGPATGGTEVTIKGDFPTIPLGVTFGGAAATDVRRIDSSTLVVVTAEHLPGPASVKLFEGFQLVPTGLTFTYTGDVPASFERLLLPIWLDPIRGQFGSEFVTAFTAQLQRGDRARLYGLEFSCRIFCPPAEFDDVPIGIVRQVPRLDGDSLVRNGNPGRFIYMVKNEVPNVAMSLRVYDRSRSAQNFGTEMPIVRESRFTQGNSVITLLDVPTDSRFRNTLRLYATGPVQVNVRVDAPTISPVDQLVSLTGGNVFEPAVATFTTFPTGVGLATVTITIPAASAGPPPPRVWAFVSVTNNDTQLITTITPQP